MRIHILIPIFEDFSCISILYKRLKNTLSDHILQFIIIDDGSYNELEIKSKLESHEDIEFLTLSQNIGHQRSIAIGLCYLSENKKFDFVLIMDGDGEDNPNDAVKLVNHAAKDEEDKIIFARRDVRSEPTTFKIGYFVYRLLFRILTGKNIKFGNFSLIPYGLINRIVGIPEIWNHYASSILIAGIPRSEISTKRSGRIHGRPKMNLQSLLLHGLSAISVFGDILLLRVLSLFSTLLLVCCVFNLYIMVFQQPNFFFIIMLWMLFCFTSLFSFGVLLLLLVKLSLRSNRPCIPKTFWKNFTKLPL